MEAEKVNNVEEDNGKIVAWRALEGTDYGSTMRRRVRRLSSVGSCASNASSSASDVSCRIVPDRAKLLAIYNCCVELFESRKITKENAFELKMLDFLKEIIDGPDFTINNLHICGRTLEVGTRIYVCRVEAIQSVVLNLASEVNLYNRKAQKRSRSQEAENEEQSSSTEDDRIQRSTSEKFWRRKSNMTNRFIEDQDSKLGTDFEGQSTKYVTRRRTLNKMFSRMVNEETDFDYLSNFSSADGSHPLKMDTDHSAADSNTDAIPSDAVNGEELKKMNFMDFNLLTDFDPEIFDAWGRPLTDAGTSVTGYQRGDVVPSSEDFLYSPDLRVELASDAEEAANGDVSDLSNPFVDGAGDGDKRIDINQPIPLDSIKSLCNLSQYYAAIKNIHQKTKSGWTGPTFFLPRLDWASSPQGDNKRKNKRRRVMDDISFENIDWNERQFISTDKSKTLLRCKTIEKWSNTSHTIPFFLPEDEDDDWMGAFALPVEDSVNDVPPMHRMYTDPNMSYESSLNQQIESDVATSVNSMLAEEITDDYFTSCGHEEHSCLSYEINLSDSAAELNMDPSLSSNKCSGADDAANNSLTSLVGFFGSSMSNSFADNFMANNTNASDPIKFVKKPERVNMKVLKATIMKILAHKLKMDEEGNPMKNCDMSTTLFELLENIYQSASQKIVKDLSIHIITVALMHVVAEKKLFMMPGTCGQLDNPLVICRGKLWKHKDHIPKDAQHTPKINSFESGWEMEMES